MEPPGNQTNDYCNGLSQGEPYRELRVYVNGQVAGFSPVYASIFTGGVAPRCVIDPIQVYVSCLCPFDYCLL